MEVFHFFNGLLTVLSGRRVARLQQQSPFRPNSAPAASVSNNSIAQAADELLSPRRLRRDPDFAPSETESLVVGARELGPGLSGEFRRETPLCQSVAARVTSRSAPEGVPVSGFDTPDFAPEGSTEAETALDREAGFSVYEARSAAVCP